MAEIRDCAPVTLLKIGVVKPIIDFALPLLSAPQVFLPAPQI